MHHAIHAIALKRDIPLQRGLRAEATSDTLNLQWRQEPRARGFADTLASRLANLAKSLARLRKTSRFLKGPLPFAAHQRGASRPRLPVISFVAEAYKRSPEIASIACVSVTQTAAEKFVGFTRRAAAELADAGGPRDRTLVRHLYDLYVTREHYDAAEVAALAREIMPHDAAEFGNQFPAYRADPLDT
jgi:hypothetical protein